jgi:hypothetical protein
MSGQIEKPPSGGVTLDRAGSGSTGTVCQYSGPYKCNTHPDMIVSFQRGQSFTVCPMSVETSKAGAGHSTTWAMVRETDATSFNIKVQRGGAEV